MELLPQLNIRNKLMNDQKIHPIYKITTAVKIIHEMRRSQPSMNIAIMILNRALVSLQLMIKWESVHQ